jgi:hypothetical protein
MRRPGCLVKQAPSERRTVCQIARQVGARDCTPCAPAAQLGAFKGRGGVLRSPAWMTANV